MSVTTIIKSGTDNGLMSQYRKNYPELMHYLEDVRGYARQTIMDVCKTITGLYAIGYDDDRILKSDIYELTRMHNGKVASKAWGKTARASITKLGDFYAYMRAQNETQTGA